MLILKTGKPQSGNPPIYYAFLASSSKDGVCDQNNPQYLGCYVDDRNRDLDHGPGVKNELDRSYVPSTCNDVCEAYAYFSIQYGGQCFCGNSYASEVQYIQKPDNDCGGAGGQGGTWRNSIFKTCVGKGKYHYLF